MMPPLRRVVGLVLLGCALPSLLWAAEKRPGIAPAEGVLILRSGDVIHGTITREGQRFRVGVPDGEIRVRADEVAFHCRDLHEGYQHKCAAIDVTRADDHIGLAAWCMQQGLLDEASEELTRAAEIDVAHPRLPLLNRRLELQRSAPREREALPIMSPRRADRADLERQTKQVPEIVLQRFTETVQPLLLNSCATAGCHGVNARSSFALVRPRSPGANARRYTQRNLASVLKHVDTSRAEVSPLLLVPIAPHGGGNDACFTHRNAKQYWELMDWVRLAAAAGNHGAATGHEEQPAGNTATSEIAENQFSAADVEATTRLGGDSLTAPIENTPDAEADPFDPVEFNRQYSADDASRE